MAASDAPCRITLLTPPGRGAVATLCVEGPAAVAAVGEHFQPARAGRLEDLPLQTIAVGHWQHTPGQPGEELVVCRRTATRVEVHCHGGPWAARRLMADLERSGGVVDSAAAWVARQAPDTISAEAWWDLTHARTQRTAAILLDQYHGALARGVQQLLHLIALPDVSAARHALAQLLGWSALGRHLVVPWQVVFTGRPNVGKSSLINALLGFSRSIVDAQPGTTRDVVTATTALDGWPVQFSDTAGLRSVDAPLERAGMERAWATIRTADLVVCVWDGTQAWTREDAAFAASLPQPLLVVNKLDRPQHLARPEGVAVLTSATLGDGLALLAETIVARLVPQVPAAGTAVAFRERHVRWLATAAVDLAGGNLARAGERLLALLNGQSAADGPDYSGPLEASISSM